MMLNLVVLLFAFAAFGAVVWSVHALNRHASLQYGYEPFAVPNAALMCIPSLLLLSALSGPETASASGELLGAPGAVDRIKLLLAGPFLVGMFGLLSWRTNLWIAAYAALVLTAAAPVVLMTVLFQRLSR